MKTVGIFDKLFYFHYKGSNVHTKSAMARFKVQHFNLILFSVFIVSQLMLVLIICNTQLKSVFDLIMKRRKGERIV